MKGQQKAPVSDGGREERKGEDAEGERKFDLHIVKKGGFTERLV